MKPCTKFIIALGVFFLLSLVVKAQRSVGDGTAVTSGITRQELQDSLVDKVVQSELADSTAAIRGDFPAGGGNNFYTSSLTGDTIPPLTTGNLAALYPGYTYAQLKTIRQANWESFQAACQWALTNTGRVLLPPAVIELHVANGESVVAGNYQTLVIKGAGKETTQIEIYPIAKNYSFVCFDFDAKGSNFIVEDLKFVTEKERLESYNVTLRPGGNTNQIQITSATVYSHTAANFIGKTVYAATDNITLATSLTVTNYNSSTKTLTVSGTVPGSSDDAGIMAIYFNEDTPRDSIRAYGNFWRTDNVENYFMYAIETSQPDVTTQYFKASNCYLSGFDGIYFHSGDETTIEIENTYMSGHIIGIAMYSNFTTNSYIIFTNNVFEDNSHAIIGYVNGPYTAGNMLGSTVYSHPNIQWRWLNCIFKNNNGGTTRQYSSGGGKPTPNNAVSFITNCRWVDNDEYDILTSETMPSYYTNCAFTGSVYAHNIAQFNNCEFKGFISSYDDDGYLKFDNCIFTSGCRLSVDQRNNFLLFEGCTFTPNTSANTLDVKVDELILRNCKFLNNAAAHSAGISIFGGEYPPRFIIEDCDFQDTDMYLWWRFAPNITSYQRLNFDKVVVKRCKFAYTPFYTSQVSLVGANNLQLIDCQFNSGTVASFGNYGINPREQVSKTILTGSTINIGANANHYYTDGTINKIAVSTGVEGYYYFTSVDTTVFTGYANPGNTGSNLLFSTTVYPNQTIKLYYDATNVKSASTSAAGSTTVGTGNGSTKCFQLWNGLVSSEVNPIKRGTMILTAGAVTLTDNGNGVLTGSGGTGLVDYFRNTVAVCFDSAPAAATNISVTYDYHTTVHQNGMWSKVE